MELTIAVACLLAVLMIHNALMAYFICQTRGLNKKAQQLLDVMSRHGKLNDEGKVETAAVVQGFTDFTASATAVVKDTVVGLKDQVEEVRKNTDGLVGKLVEATRQAAELKGKNEGKAEAKAESETGNGAEASPKIDRIDENVQDIKKEVVKEVKAAVKEIAKEEER